MRQQAARSNSRGFTLIELLVVIAVIGILAAAILYALNPETQFARARNSRRIQEVDQISKAIVASSISEGEIPTTIPQTPECATTATNEICRTDASSCAGLVDLSVLTNGQKYLIEMPADQKSSGNGTGYFVMKNANNRVTVCAPLAEKGATISATR